MSKATDEYYMNCGKEIAEEFERMTPEQVIKDYPAIWFAVNHKFSNLSEQDRAGIISLVLDVCPHCRERVGPCRCWDDS